MWDKIEHAGFEIWVLPIIGVWTRLAPDTLYQLHGVFLRPMGAHATIRGPRHHGYTSLSRRFGSAKKRGTAGYPEGTGLVDRTWKCWMFS